MAVDIEQMTVAERLELITRLWDSIPNALEGLPVPDWHREEIGRRIAAADASPEQATSWDEVKRHL